MIDANIIFAVLITKGETDRIFFETGLEFFAPPTISEEIARYEGYLSEKTKRSRHDFKEVFSAVKEKVKIVAVRKEMMKRAKVFSPDPEDTSFLALALQIGRPLWTNDKRLKEQDEVIVLSTEEIMRLF